MIPIQNVYSRQATSFYGQSMVPVQSNLVRANTINQQPIQYGIPQQQIVQPAYGYAVPSNNTSTSAPPPFALNRQRTMANRPVSAPYQQQMGFPPVDMSNIKLLGRGIGIDEREYACIINSCVQALASRADPLSAEVVKLIKQGIGGEWFVFTSKQGLAGYDFSLSVVTGNDFLSFIHNNFHFQICRLRD